jgi:hypothetical protein
MTMPFETFTRNYGWKLLSLGLAVVIWITIKTQSSERDQAEKMYLNIPVQIVSSTADVRAFAIEPTVVRVVVRGRTGAMARLNERQIHAFVDITSADFTRPFRGQVQVATPNGFTVISFEPSEVQVTPPPAKEPLIIITPPVTNQ